jgi:hypothetical protein
MTLSKVSGVSACTNDGSALSRLLRPVRELMNSVRASAERSPS